MYTKRIDTARKLVAVSFTVCSLGFAAAANLHPRLEHGWEALVAWTGVSWGSERSRR